MRGKSEYKREKLKKDRERQYREKQMEKKKKERRTNGTKDRPDYRCLGYSGHSSLTCVVVSNLF